MAIRHSPHHHRVALACALGGLVLLSGCWTTLVLSVRGRADGAAVAARTALAWCLPLLLAPPVFSGDGWSYVATGYLTGHGVSPYDVPVAVLPVALKSAVNPVWRHTFSPYGPLPLAWGGIFSRVTADPWLLLLAYRVLALVSLAVLAWALARLAGRTGRDPATVVAVVVGSPFVIAHGVGGLHNDLLVAALATCALALTTPGRWWPGAVLAGAAAAVKVPGGLVVLGVLVLALDRREHWRACARRVLEVLGLALVVLLGSGLVVGVGEGWTRTVLATGADAYNHLSLPGQVAWWVSPSLATVVRDAGIVAVVLAVGYLLRRGRPPADAVGVAVVALAGIALLAPVVHYWYLLWALPLAAGLRLDRAGRFAVATAIGVLGLLAVDDASFHISPGASEVAAVMAYALPVAAYLMARLPARARSEAAPVAQLRRPAGPTS